MIAKPMYQSAHANHKAEMIIGACLDILIVEGPKTAGQLVEAINERPFYGRDASNGEVRFALRWLRAKGHIKRDGGRRGCLHKYRGRLWKATHEAGG